MPHALRPVPQLCTATGTSRGLQALGQQSCMGILKVNFQMEDYAHYLQTAGRGSNTNHSRVSHPVKVAELSRAAICEPWRLPG